MILEKLWSVLDMTADAAAEYIDYNVIRACPYYDPSPIVIFDIESL